MRHQLRTTFATIAASVVLTACADRTTPAPTGPNVLIPSSVTGSVAAPTCDIPALKGYERDFAKSNRDVLGTIITDLQAAVKNGPSDAGTDKVFDGLARVAAIRGTTDQKSGVTGDVFNNLVKGFFGCAQSNVLVGAEDQDFSNGVGIGSTWLFEVRGKNNTPAKPYDDLTGWAYQRSTATSATWWAAGPGIGTDPEATRWNRSITSAALPKRFLIYGYPVTDFLNINGRFGSAFELRTIPKISDTFGISLKIGLCFFDAENITSSQRLNHFNEFVPNSALTCGTTRPPAIVASTSGAFGELNPMTLVQRAVGLLTPRPAYAAFAVGSVGGAVSELSPSAVYDLSAIDALTGLGTIPDGKISKKLVTTLGPIVVRAMTKPVGTVPGTPVEAVPIELAIAGNSSSIAFFSEGLGGTPVATVTRLTDANGYATFDDVFLTKAGGYQVTLRVSFDGVAGPAVLSNSFNYQNK
jgi:hypothetical protein